MARVFNSYVPEKELNRQARLLATLEASKMRNLNITSLSQISEHYNLKLIEKPLPSGKDGAFNSEKREIILNSNIKSQERRRFTFFHELMHPLIEQCDDILSSLHQNYHGSELEKAIERLCNVGAAEWLVPSQEIRKHISEGDYAFSTETIPLLCKKYIASAFAVSIQLVSVIANHRCYLVIASPQALKNNTNHNFYLQVICSAKSQAAKYHIGRGTIISKDHLITSAYQEKKHVKGRDKIPFRNGKGWPVDCDAIYFKEYIFAFFHESAPLSTNQLYLFVSS